MIIIKIKEDDDAMATNARQEFPRILREIADKAEAVGEVPSIVYDINGNRVASCRRTR